MAAPGHQECAAEPIESRIRLQIVLYRPLNILRIAEAGSRKLEQEEQQGSADMFGGKSPFSGRNLHELSPQYLFGTGIYTYGPRGKVTIE